MEGYNELAALFGSGLAIIVLLLAVFDAVLKIIGMWKSARRSQTGWFVCLAIFNTLGILPIIYFLTGGKKPETLTKPGAAPVQQL